MAKKKRQKKNNHRKQEKKGGVKLPFFALPEGSRRLVWGVVLGALALIYLFAFFERAGQAGTLLFSLSQLLFGQTAFLLPLLFVIGMLTLFAAKEDRVSPVFLSLFLALFAISGITGSFARAQDISPQDLSGLFGWLVSWPVFGAFGFWVSEIVFFAFFAAAFVIAWKAVPHDQEKLKLEPPERMKKVFEPKFEVEKLEQPAPALEVVQEEKEQQKEKKASLQKRKGQELAFLGDYKLPPTSLLEGESGTPSAGDVQAYSAIIKKTLHNFGIPVEMTEVNIGPTVTQYAIKPSEGIKLSRITGLSNDLALALAAHPIRIEAPIPGRALVGIEVPNKARAQVRLKPMLESDAFKNASSPLQLALGKDVSGNPVLADLARMPHLLVAGATGAGKTIGLNNVLMSLLYRNSPSNLRLILVDPKRVEFLAYNDLPHLLTPVILDTQRTINALKWLIKEMERRFQVFSRARVRDIRSYHALASSQQEKGNGKELEQIPYIVIVIDELADLMASRGKEMESMIVRLAQMARAVGIHLVLATQRPSVEVITGLIKANITSRAAFQVASQIDSRTILDTAGAEKLLGQGDMLFVSAEVSKPKRIQGAYVSDKEVKKVVAWIEKETRDYVRQEIEEDELSQSAIIGLESPEFDGEDDPLYDQARSIVVEYQKASASLLQRRLKIGYARAARLLDILESKGVIGRGEGAKPREVYVTRGGAAPMLEMDQEEDQESIPQQPEEKQDENKEDSSKEEESPWFTP